MPFCFGENYENTFAKDENGQIPKGKIPLHTFHLQHIQVFKASACGTTSSSTLILFWSPGNAQNMKLGVWVKIGLCLKLQHIHIFTASAIGAAPNMMLRVN